MVPKREVICADSLPWLAQRPHSLDAIVTGLPDLAEMEGMLPDSYAAWFIEAVGHCLRAVRPEGYAIFCQTDRKLAGHLLSKAAMCFEAASRRKAFLVWHKIVLRRKVGAVDFFRPGFCHLMCFSKLGTAGRAGPDVFTPEPLSWANGMPITAIRYAVEFAGRNAPATIVDPFCGIGTVLAIAGDLGLDATGIDISEDMCAQAREYGRMLNER